MLNLPPTRKTKSTIMTFPILKTFKHLGYHHRMGDAPPFI